MIPNGPGQANSYLDFISQLSSLVREGRVPMSRIDDAVRRILRVKFEAGVFEQQPVDPALTAAIGSIAHRKVARECVRQSLVLLKNNSAVLPLSKNLKRVLVVGKAADDLGVQCGGWTISWQGTNGPVTRGGTTLLEGIRRTVSSSTSVSFSPDGSGVERADAVVVVVGEKPYAETPGDRSDLRLSAADAALIKRAKQSGAPVVAVLLSGRPLVLGDALDACDAFVAAWLPGTEGQGVADVLFGECKPTGKLPRAWPRAVEPAAAQSSAASQPQTPFPFGYGLAYGDGSATDSSRVKTISANP
jgi:beta-glucosidase